MNIVFATLRNTFDKNPVAREMPLEQFVEYVCDTSKRLSVDPSWTKEEYDAAKIKQKAIAPVGGRRKNAILEDSVVKFDFDHLNRTQYRDLTRKFKNAPFFNILHTTASHQHACKNGDYAFRVLVPARTPFNSNDAWMVQRAICAELEIDESLRDHCTEDGNRLIYLPHKESKITVTEGRVIRAERYIKKAEEMGLRKREAKTLAADEHGLNADIAHFCEAELGLDALSSGRGYEVPCPNEHLHTGKGSTSIMLDGKEVRFVCQHTNNGACTELNRRQHLALRMCGLPDELNVDKQPISINSIRAALPDLPDEEIEELHRTENEEPVTCTLEDLEDDDELPEPVKADFVVEGYMPSDCIWDIVGESGTYKSFYTLGVMYLSAAGYRFAGADTQRCHHFYIDGEGGAATRTRIDALAAKYGREGKDYVHVIDMGEVLTAHGDKKIPALIRRMRETANGEPIGMVAFDTLNQTLALTIDKFDENSSSTTIGMGKVIAILKEVRDATKAAVGVVHHTPKGGKKARGSGALYAGVDVELTIERATDRQINVYHSKFKHGPQQKTVGMVLESVQFREAPPAKEYRAVEFLGSTEEYGTIVNLDLPEPHKALVLMPWGFEPFKTDEEKEREEGLTNEGKQKVKEKVNRGRDEVRKESILSALEDLQQSDDTGRGFTQQQIVARSGDFSVTNTHLDKMLKDGELMLGCDVNGEVVPRTYRIPERIVDRLRPKTIYEPNEMLVVTEEDLE
ncbi:replicative DNA helicase [Escherichia phage UTI-CM001]|uniref:replicative DNA helicase n=1 Tax=Escherichia phage UTI-CM001 TaxID=2923096 RepID=UPI004054C7AE|nr:replicative DNA helicase [Escherichia phage UTI-CM001]